MMQIALSLLMSASLLLTQANDPKLATILTPEYRQTVQSIALQAIAYAKNVLETQPTQDNNVNTPSVPVMPVVPSVQPPVQAIIVPVTPVVPDPIVFTVQPIVTVKSIDYVYRDANVNGIPDCPFCFESKSTTYHIHFETNASTTVTISPQTSFNTMNEDITISGTVFDYDFTDLWSNGVFYDLYVDGMNPSRHNKVNTPMYPPAQINDGYNG